MRLLVDCHVFDGKFQGTRTYLQGIYQNMVEHKDIDFYFAAQDIENLKKCFREGENIHYVKLTTGGSIKRLASEFPRIVKECNIDYAHYQYISTLTKCCKEIVTVHDLLFLDYPQYFSLGYRLKNGFLFKRSAKRADMLLTVSDYSRKAIERLFGIPASKIFVTPNAVLPAEADMPRPDVKKKFGLDKYIMTVSRIEPRKNHLTLLKAFVELQFAEKGYRLMMVGVPDLAYKEFTAYYDSLPQTTKDAVIMKSASFPELVELYRQANLFVFPSYAEGFGIPPLEAIEYGCPVLCSNATAMAEFDLPEEWTFDPYNEAEMKTKMLNLLENRPDLISVRTKIQERFNWKKIADELYEVIMNRV